MDQNAHVRVCPTEAGHQGADQSASRTEQEDGGTASGALRSLLTVRAAIFARHAAEGCHVQEQTQARPFARFHGPKVSAFT